MRTLNTAFLMLILATAACGKDEAAKPAETAKASGAAKPADKPADMPAKPAGSGNACADLKTKLCEGLDAAKCGTWFDAEIAKDELNEGKTLDASEQSMACKMIMGDAQSLEGWKGMAKEKGK